LIHNRFIENFTHNGLLQWLALFRATNTTPACRQKRVVAYKNGQEWAGDVVQATEKPSQLSMSADRPAVSPDGKDLIFVTVRIEDKDKLLVPRSNNQLDFSITGPGRIVTTRIVLRVHSIVKTHSAKSSGDSTVGLALGVLVISFHMSILNSILML